MKLYYTKNAKRKSGFTIIETMVSISVFMVVIMFGMTALLNANLVHQKSKNIHSIIDNLNFILEDMSRNIRTGYHYRCYETAGSPSTPTGDAALATPKSCAGGWALVFESTNGNPADNTDQWGYFVSGDGRIYKATLNLSSGSGSYIQLTPCASVNCTSNNEIYISPSSGFTVLGAEPPTGDYQQPLVTIRLVGTMTYKNITTPFNLQTTVSQRLSDI